MAVRWRLRPFEPDRIRSLAASAGLTSLTAQLLLNRGVTTPEAARVFLENRLTSLHDPETLPGIVEAAERIRAAVLEGRRVVIYGDYDVDGVCGTSLLLGCLRLAGAKSLDYYIPHRVEEGYGINAEALRKIAEAGPALVVTVDCGISAIGPAELARELGLELIITDHHHIGDRLPEADVLVHPRLPGGSYPFGDLCGCGVAFKLAWQVAKSFGDGKKASPHLREFLIEAVMLVALATVADVMPLLGENRLLVHHGLNGLSMSPTLGLRALLDVAGLSEAPRGINSGHVGFGLAPRINAAGRLERASTAVEMLTARDESTARRLAETLDACNRERQETEQSMVAEARELVEKSGPIDSRAAIVVAKDGWHKGIVGIVASRLVDIHHRPTIVLTIRDGMAQGSARSVPGFDLYAAIAACSDLLDRFGGHEAAAGLELAADRLDEFSERFEARCRETLTPELRDRVISIDAETSVAQLDLRTLETIGRLEPHGVGNPRPTIQITRCRVAGEVKRIGQDQRHIKFRIVEGDSSITALGWSMSDRAAELQSGVDYDFVGHPSINEFNGRREAQLELRDFRRSGSKESTG
ncbi:MAG: single-stranded-DNA-specific exonuclease RecJ [Isosphaeraceae bacterium]|nr:single-stranded-DNA-specific exonuclease RecJ [Isosphaeraceae bacterium]